MFSQILHIFLVIRFVEPYTVQKFINPCGVIYSSVTPNHHGVRRVFHHLKPHIMEIIHTMKASHHKFMEEYKYRKTWIPEETSIILTNNALNSAKQLPDIYRNLQYFSYALDIVQEDALEGYKSEDCFFVVDSLPNVISKHQRLMCAVDSALGQLNLEAAAVRTIDLPEEWVNPNDKSCVHKFFRFSEVHTKYRKYLQAVFELTQI